MGEDVTDRLLPEVSGLLAGESLGGSALAKVLAQIDESSAKGANNSFSASIG